MTEAKIEICIGELRFSGQGDPVWLSDQLDKILDRAGELTALAPTGNGAESVAAGDAYHKPADLSAHGEIAAKPLAVWLRETNAETSQTVKFLSTAIWIEAKGQNRLRTKDITGALSNSNQRRLSNASDCLIKNVKKGFCEKEGNQFYVTEEGKRSVGIG